MTKKTAPLLDDTHKRIKGIKKMLYDKYKISMSIQDILDYLVPNPEEGSVRIIERINH